MGIPTEIQTAIEHRECVDLSTLVLVTGNSDEWGSVAEELRVAQDLGSLGVGRVLGILQKRAPEQAFPQMADGGYAFAPLLLPLPGRDGFFHCGIDTDSGGVPQVIRLTVNIGKPTTIHFVVGINPNSGGVNTLSVHHRARNDLAVDCTWRRRPNSSQLLFSQMRWARPGVTREFFWAKGLGKNSMPEGFTGQKWLVQGHDLAKGDSLCMAGSLSK